MKKKNLPIQDAAEKLCLYTLGITQNLNNFPKKYRHTLVDRILNITFDIADHIDSANILFGEDRLYYITLALGDCRKNKRYIRMVYEKLHPECSIPYWDSLVTDVEEQLLKWQKYVRGQLR